MKRIWAHSWVFYALLVAVLLTACAPTSLPGTAGGSELVSEAEAVSEGETESAFAPTAESETVERRVNWYVDQDGTIFYFTDDGKTLTGWQYLNDQWFNFASDGSAITGWTSQDGVDYYCDPKTGAMVTNGPVEGAWWADSEGHLSEVGDLMGEGGTQRWTDVSDTDREALVAYLTAHASDYLGTVYSSWPCSEPGVGMHCAGFVDRAIYDAGFVDGFWNDLRGTGYERYTYNDGYMYRPEEDVYSNENCWHVGGWALWARIYDLHWVSYRTHEDAMAGAQRGEFQKGDIMIYSWTNIVSYDLSGLEHVCFYWGDENDWSLIWESSPIHDNAIVPCSEYESYIYVLTSA